LGHVVAVPARPRSSGALRCRRKFLRFFKQGFYDETYLDWERGYKWAAHATWDRTLGETGYRRRLKQADFAGIAADAVRLESRTNLLFSFEKMALRDALTSAEGARVFAEGLFDYVYGRGDLQSRFERWVEVVAALPRRQTRVLTWPLATVFGFIGDPKTHMFLKPNVTRVAAREYGFPFAYTSRPNWDTYQSLLDFAATVRRDVRDLRPRDLIDIQSFIWVQGSGEYEE
jgi:hypothetical protein